MSFHYRREAGEKGKLHRKNGVGLGLNLDNLIRAEILSIGAAIQLLSYIADALTDAHKNDHCHGDICLDDIKVDVYGAVLVNGFGRPRTTTLAPEQRPQGGSTDVYGLGVVLLATLSGEESFRPPQNTDDHDRAIVQKMISMDWRELSDEPWLIKIQEFLIMALSLEPEERPSALDVANVLGGVLQNTNGPFLAEIISENSGLFDVEEEYGDAEILESGVSELEPISLIPDSSQGAATGLWPREKILEMLMAEEESVDEPERKEWKPETVRESSSAFEDEEPTVPDRPPITLNSSQEFGNSTFQNMQFDPSDINAKEDMFHDDGDFNSAEDYPTDVAPADTDPFIHQHSDTITKPVLTEPTQPKKTPSPTPTPVVQHKAEKNLPPNPGIRAGRQMQHREQPSSPNSNRQSTSGQENRHRVQNISNPNTPRQMGSQNTKMLMVGAAILVLIGIGVGWKMTDAKNDGNQGNKPTSVQDSKTKDKGYDYGIEDTGDVSDVKEEKTKTVKTRKTKTRTPPPRKPSTTKTKKVVKTIEPPENFSKEYRVNVSLTGIEGTITCGDGSKTEFSDRFSKNFSSRQNCVIEANGASGFFSTNAAKSNFKCTSDGVQIKCR